MSCLEPAQLEQVGVCVCDAQMCGWFNCTAGAIGQTALESARQQHHFFACRRGLGLPASKLLFEGPRPGGAASCELGRSMQFARWLEPLCEKKQFGVHSSVCTSSAAFHHLVLHCDMKPTLVNLQLPISLIPSAHATSAGHKHVGLVVQVVLHLACVVPSRLMVCIAKQNCSDAAGFLIVCQDAYADMFLVCRMPY